MLNPPVSKRDHTIGPWNAEVVIVEYGDFECPYCAAAEPVFRALRETLPNSVLFAYRHFPLGEAHPHALHAAEASEAAGAQGKFWEMHDMLYENQEKLKPQDLAGYAMALKLDERFVKDVNAGTFTARIKHDFQTGLMSGVNGTPSLFINGERYDGERDVASLLEVLRGVAEDSGRGKNA